MRSNVEKLAQSLQPWYNRNAGASPQSFRRDKGVIHLKRTLIYDNPLNDLASVKDFILEGSAALSFPRAACAWKTDWIHPCSRKQTMYFGAPRIFRRISPSLGISGRYGNRGWPSCSLPPKAETVKICLTPLCKNAPGNTRCTIMGISTPFISPIFAAKNRTSERFIPAICAKATDSIWPPRVETRSPMWPAPYHPTI